MSLNVVKNLLFLLFDNSLFTAKTRVTTGVLPFLLNLPCFSLLFLFFTPNVHNPTAS